MQTINDLASKKELNMSQEDFFSHIEAHYKAKRPFVAYRNPNESLVKGMLQNDNSIYTVEDFTESGFLFSPFDSEKKAVLFPTEQSIIMTSEILVSSEKVTNSSPNLPSEETRQHHINLVQKGIDAIKENSFQKVVLSRVEIVPISEDNPLQIFKSLLDTYTTAFVYLWFHPKVGLWLGATPETLLNTEGQRFNTMSLAGTQHYKNTLEADWDSKNREEQQLVTDFIVNHLKPYVKQINVSEAKTIRAGQLLHLQSQISGVLNSNRLKEVITVLHPTPAVCGLPKEEAKTFILANENYNREFYTGFLGELNMKRSKTRNANKRNVENNAYSTVKTVSKLYVNLRCMQIKSHEALIYVGGGITKDSNPEKEWEETINKSHTIKRIICK